MSPSSVGAIVARYLAEETPLKAAATQRHDAAYAKVVNAAWGDLEIHELTPGAVSRLHRSISKERGPVLANRILSFVSQVCVLAERDDLRPAQSNPTKATRRNSELRSTEFLAAPMRTRFIHAAGDALAAGEITRSAWTLLCLMLLGGLRWSEARLLRWEEVDLANKCLRYHARGALRAENKGGDQRTVSLSDDVLDLLHIAPRICGWVAPNPKTRQPYTDIRCALRRVCDRAGVKIRPHGLRHSFGTEAAEAGCSLFEIASLLGQSSESSAHRYVAQSAAQRLGRRISGRST